MISCRGVVAMNREEETQPEGGGPMALVGREVAVSGAISSIAIASPNHLEGHA